MKFIDDAGLFVEEKKEKKAATTFIDDAGLFGPAESSYGGKSAIQTSQEGIDAPKLPKPTAIPKAAFDVLPGLRKGAEERRQVQAKTEGKISHPEVLPSEDADRKSQLKGAALATIGEAAKGIPGLLKLPKVLADRVPSIQDLDKGFPFKKIEPILKPVFESLSQLGQSGVESIEKRMAAHPGIKSYRNALQKGDATFLEKVVGQIGPTLVSAGTGLISPPLAFAYFYGLNDEEVRAQVRDRGGDIEAEDRASRNYTWIVSALDAVGIGAIIRKVPAGRGFLRHLLGYAEATFGEMITEPTQDIISDVGAQWETKDKEESSQEFFTRLQKDIPRLAENAWETAKIAAAIGGAAHTLTYARGTKDDTQGKDVDEAPTAPETDMTTGEDVKVDPEAVDVSTPMAQALPDAIVDEPAPAPKPIVEPEQPLSPSQGIAQQILTGFDEKEQGIRDEPGRPLTPEEEAHKQNILENFNNPEALIPVLEEGYGFPKATEAEKPAEKEKEPTPDVPLPKEVKKEAKKKKLKPPPKVPPKSDPEKDSLSTFVRKEGGLNYDAEALKGELDRLTKKEGVHGIVRKNKTGWTIDQMLERAREEGYFEGDATPADFLTALEGDLGDAPFYSTAKVFTEKDIKGIPVPEKKQELVVAGSLDLEVGDSFTIDGEQFDVRRLDEDGNLIIEDGFTYEVDPFDMIPKPDEGSVKRKEQGDFELTAQEKPKAKKKKEEQKTEELFKGEETLQVGAKPIIAAEVKEGEFFAKPTETDEERQKELLPEPLTEEEAKSINDARVLTRKIKERKQSIDNLKGKKGTAESIANLQLDIDAFQKKLDKQKDPTKERADEPKGAGGVFTKEKSDAAKKRIQGKMNRLNAGFDVSMVKDAIEVGGHYVETGIRKFSDFAKKMVKAFGESIRKHLRSIYNSIRLHLGNQRGSISFKDQPGDQKKAKQVPEEDKKFVERIAPPENATYEQLEDYWHGNKDLLVLSHSIQREIIREEISRTAGEEKYGPKSREIDRAIHIHIDTKRNPGHIKEFYSDLTAEQKADIDRSQALTSEQKKIADKIDKQYQETGVWAKKFGLINNILENYAARFWKQDKKGSSLKDEGKRKFATTTRHKKHRSFETIIEGWAKGKTLSIDGASDSLQILQDTIAKTIEDKRLIQSMKETELPDGTPLLTQKEADGLVAIEHPNFTWWRHDGKVGADGETHYSYNEIITEDGDVFRRAKLYTLPDIAKRLNNILGTSKLRGMAPIDVATKYNAAIKAIVLQTSLFHHMAFMWSYGFGVRKKRFGKGEILPWQAYKTGLKAIKNYESELMFMVHNGLTLQINQDWQQDILNREETFLGEWMNKSSLAKAAKDKVKAWQRRQAEFLFNEFGAGLKSMAALIEWRNSVQEHPGMDPRERAKMIAGLVNNDFGGLHLGREARSPTTQHVARLSLLAADWSESNLRTITKLGPIKKGGVPGTGFLPASKEERRLYQKFWGSVLGKGMALHIIGSLMLAGLDGEKDFVERFEDSWKRGHMKWLMWDITPIYRGVTRVLGKEPTTSRKYFRIFGHFMDPIKWVTTSPFTSLKHKGSIFTRFVGSLITGSNWQGRQYTSIDEVVGLDDKGVYLTTTKDHKAGEPKGGKHKWKMTKWGIGTKDLELSQIPSLMAEQARGWTPIQVQNTIAALTGEIDWFDAITKSAGLRVTGTRPQSEEEIKRRDFKKLARKINEANAKYQYLKEGENPEKAVSFREDNKTEIALHGRLSFTERRIGRLKRQKAKIEKRMKGGPKKEKNLLDINKDISDEMESFSQRYEETK